MQKLGQHFLKNEAVAKKIIDALEIRAHDAIIEIGPGRGALTTPLARACHEAGASLALIEKDARLAEAMELGYAESNASGESSVVVHRGDALALLPSLMSALSSLPPSSSSPKRTVKLVGNLPYYITGKLLRIISEMDEKPERCVFMVQREVAERIAARPPEMNRLAASVQFWSAPEIIALVPKKDFAPPPKVDSAVVALATNAKPATPAEQETYYAAVRALFAQPRKTLMNNLSAAQPMSSKQELAVAVESLHLDPGMRPQDLSLENIKSIAKAFFEK